MPDDDDPRDVRRPKIPPTAVAKQIRQDDTGRVTLSREPRRPDPMVQLADRVRTISTDLHENTLETALLKQQLNTVSVEQKTLGEKVEGLTVDVTELAKQSAGQTAELKVLNGLLAKQLDANNSERTAAADHRRKAVEKILAVLLGIIVALQVYYLGSK